MSSMLPSTLSSSSSKCYCCRLKITNVNNNKMQYRKDPGKSVSSSTQPSGGATKTDLDSNKKKQISSTTRKKPETKKYLPLLSGSSSKQPKNIRVTQTRRLSSSASSLVSNRHASRPAVVNQRPQSAYETDKNVTLRKRGQSHQQQQQAAAANHHHHDDLSRTSSITNLNADKSKTSGTKPKKTESRDKLDKLVEQPKKKQLIPKNNNKEFESGSEHEQFTSLIDVEILQKQLAQMAAEKSNLALQLGEQTGQLNQLYKEVNKLKVFKEESSLRLEQLVEENASLRNRLRDVAHSPLSDNEKQQLLYDSHRHHSSAPASIATNVDDGGGDGTACPTPEWDKHSSSNVSEVSVACLQDKINQMQETHYSTNEELQATLQELTDLQRQLTELQQENVRLNEEKTLMFESLCRQTERLNDSRNEVEQLKQLLYKDENAEFESAVEREQKLVDLVKTIEDEKESLLIKHQQLGNDLEDSRSTIQVHNDEILQLKERNKTLESILDAKNAENKQLDHELQQTRDQLNGKQIEINRLNNLLENARTKINALEQDRALSDKSELDELLDNARKEKDGLESEVAHLKEQLALSRNDVDKLKEQISILQEECKVIRNNAKTTQSDLEYKLEKLALEKNSLTEQLQQFQEHVNELQLQQHCQLDEKRQLSTVLSETQRNLAESERRVDDLKDELAEVKRKKEEQEDDWEKFQNDLLTSVRVANDFKTEAQQDLQKLIMENKAGRERIKQLEQQIEKMKVVSSPNEPTVHPLPPSTSIRPTSFQMDEITTRRQKVSLSRQNSRQSVKSLIESIENAGKPPSGTGMGKTVSLNSVSRSSSSSSLNSLTQSEGKTPNSPSIGCHSPGSPLKSPLDWMENNGSVKTPLKEQQPNKINRDWSKTVIGDSLTKNELVKNKTDDNYRETILQKGLDFSRRNSYSDLSERKDPLNGLVKNGGSKRNALLKWCQNKTVGYRNIDITNFSSSWNDGLALCALLHTYLPDLVPYDNLNPHDKRRNFSLAFNAAESVGIPTTLNINDMILLERPDWQQVMSYVTAIYKHFET